MGEWDEMRVSDAIRELGDLLARMEHDHPALPGACVVCRCRSLVGVVAKADRMYRSEKSMVTERVRRENAELRERLRITTELLEGKTPRV